MNTPNLAIIAATVGDDVKAFRSAAVTAENKATPFARSMLAALLSGVMTKLTAETAIIHAFGNPKSQAGKAIAKLSSVGDYLPGWGAVRKTYGTVTTLFDNIDSAPGVRPLVVAFVLNEPTAAKSLRALDVAVRDAIAKHVEETAPANDDAVADNEAAANDAPTTTTTPEPAVSLTDRVMALMVAYEAASPDEKNVAHDAIAMFFDMVNADVARDADAAFDTVEEPAPLAANG